MSSPQQVSANSQAKRLLGAVLRSHPGLLAGLGIALVAGVLLFGNLSYPLLEPDEGRYAEIPLLMLQKHELLVPMLHGKPYNDKPPLTYWLTALAYAAFGPSEATARLVPAVASWLCILAIYGWAWRTLGWRSALASALVLCTMAGFLGFGRMLLLDGVLTLWVVLGLLTGHLALTGPRLHWGWWLTSAVCVGLGVLTKGPVALVLVGPPLALYRFLDAGSARWRFSHALAYLLMALALCAPWYLAILVWNPEFAQDFFWRHNWQRFLTPFHHQKPWWFYGPVLLAEMLPWSLLLPLVAWSLWQNRLRPAVRLCAVAAGWVLLFFSIASCKLPTYLMPLLPLCAVVLGDVTAHGLCQTSTASRRKVMVLGAILTFAVAGMTLLLAIGHVLASGLEWVEVLVGSALLVGTLIALVALANNKESLLWASAFSVCVVFAAFWAWDVIPEHAEDTSAGCLVKELQHVADAEGAVLAAYRGQWDAASFYQGGDEVAVISSRHPAALHAFMAAHPRTLILVRAGARDDVGRLRQQLPSGVVVERELEAGKVHAVLLTRQP